MAKFSTKQLTPVERERLLKLATAARPGPTAAHHVPIAARTNREAAPLSFIQQQLWFISQLDGSTRANRMSLTLRLAGRLDREALQRALDHIIERHDALRTTFALVDGSPVQIIHPAGDKFLLSEDDLRDLPEPGTQLERLLAEEAAAGFDLQNGPLIRGRLVKVRDNEHVLRLMVHHIVFDGWSMGVLIAELGLLYDCFREGRANPLPALAIQYPDYAIWQRNWLNGEVLKSQTEYWQGALAGAQAALELPTDRARTPQRDDIGSLVDLEFDARTTEELSQFSQRHGVTLFMTLLTAWAVLLMRIARQKDIVIGTVVARRNRVEVEPLIGCFLNTLALRLDLSGNPTVVELLERVKARALAAQRHQDLPFEQLVELIAPVRSSTYTPVFQVLFNWQDAGKSGGLQLPGLDVKEISPSQVFARANLTLDLTKHGDRIVGALEFAQALFDRATIERYCGHLRNVLTAMLADDSQRIDRFTLLDTKERNKLLQDWNATEAPYPREKCVHELFEEQVRKTPGALALVFEDQRLTYEELNRRANQLANYLRARGVETGELVGLCVERSAEMVIAILGVLKAGGAYVPLDPGYPAERLQYMLRDASPRVLLTQVRLMSDLGPIAASMVALDRDWKSIGTCDSQNLDPRVVALSPAHPAYVIYTSGSTGAPKGVMVEHRNVVNELLFQEVQYGSPAGQTILQFSPAAFDAAVEEILNLALGATLILGTETQVTSLDGFSALCVTHEVSRVALPVRFWEQLVRHGVVPASLRCVIIGGEAARGQSVRAWFDLGKPGTELFNAYGPTETTICAARYRCNSRDCGPPPIGRPITNGRIYLLDEYLEPAPVGVTGEIYIAGAGVARGYINKPALTAERFSADPFGAPGTRMYRTGDLGRYLPDGNIEYLGRNDFQVKIRGFRIELGEIEAKLQEHIGVCEAVVIAREEQGDKRLVAYYRRQGDVAPGVESLRSHLQWQLPEYMVPAAYVEMEQWPVTSNGKLDRKALPAPEGEAFLVQTYEPPEGETEQTLSQIWSELLGVERVGRQDNFFELGGHSLLAVSVIERMRQAGLQADVRSLFETPTLTALASATKLFKEVEL